MDETRREKGLKAYEELSGGGENVFASFDDLGDLILEFGFGDVYGRGTLALRERQMCTMSIQIAQGHLPQLRLHIQFSHNIGITVAEMEELIIHTVPYAGFPTAMNAWRVLQELKPELLEKEVEQNHHQ